MSRAPIRRSLVVACLVATAGGAAVATAPSASASPAFGAITVAAQSASNLTTYKTARAYCGSRKVVAAGAKINGGGGQVVINGITPDATLSSVFVTAYSDGATTAWSVVAYASCGLAPAGIERVAASSAYTSADKTVTATCPSTKRLLSLTGNISGGFGRVVMGTITPNSGLTSGYISGRESDPITTTWQVQAYAICAYPPSGLGLYYANSSYSSASPKSMMLSCPTGKLVVSVAASLPAIGPTPSDVGMSSLGWDAGYHVALLTADEHDPYAGSWLLTGLVICATG